MIELALVALSGGVVGWLLRGRRATVERREAVRDAVRTEDERRREAMRIHGRETWERSEHEGMRPSRVTDVDVT